MSRESEINYATTQIEFSESESETAVAIMGKIKGGYFDDLAGIMIITNEKIVFSSEPNPLSFIGGSQGQWYALAWSFIDDLRIKSKDEIEYQVFIDNKIVFVQFSIDRYEEPDIDISEIFNRCSFFCSNTINHKVFNEWESLEKFEENKDYKNCLRTVQRIKTKSSLSSVPIYFEAYYKSLLGDFSDNFLDLVQAAEKKGYANEGELRLLQGKYYLSKDNYEQAELYLKECIKFIPENTEALKILATAQFKLNKYGDVETTCKNLLKIEPDNLFALYQLFEVAINEKNKEYVKQHYNALSSKISDKESEEYYLVSAKYYLFFEKFDQAYKYCKYLMGKNSVIDFEEIYIVFGVCLGFRKHEEFLSYLDKVKIENDDQKNFVNFLRLMNLIELERFDELDEVRTLKDFDEINGFKDYIEIVYLMETKKDTNISEKINICRAKLNSSTNQVFLSERDITSISYSLDYYLAMEFYKNNNKEEALKLFKNVLKLKRESLSDERIYKETKSRIKEILKEKEQDEVHNIGEESLEKKYVEKTQKTFLFNKKKNLTRKHLIKIKKIFDSNDIFEDLRDSVSEISAEYNRPFLLTVLGEFNAGKSTFINALLGEKILSIGDVPTTATISLLKYDKKKYAKIIWNDDSEEDISLNELKKYTVEKNEDDNNKDLLRQIKYVEIFYPSEILKSIWIVDTPGLNAIIPEHKIVTNQFIKKCDGVVWLFSAKVAGKESELEALINANEYSSKTIGIINQIDTIDPDERDEVIEDISNDFSGLISKVVAISAKKALDGRINRLDQKINSSGIIRVEQIINDEISEQAMSLKEQSIQQKIIHYSEKGLKKFEKSKKGVLELSKQIVNDKKTIDNLTGCVAPEEYNKLDVTIDKTLSQTFKNISSSLFEMDARNELDEVLLSNYSLDIKKTTDFLVKETIGSFENAPQKLINKISRTIQEISTVNDAPELKLANIKYTSEFTCTVKELNMLLNNVLEYASGQLESEVLHHIYGNEIFQKNKTKNEITSILLTRFSYIKTRLKKAISIWSKELVEILLNTIDFADGEVRAKIEKDEFSIAHPLRDLISEIVSNRPFFDKEMGFILFEWEKEGSIFKMFFKLLGALAYASDFKDEEKETFEEILSEMNLTDLQKENANNVFYSSLNNKQDVQNVVENIFTKHRENYVLLEIIFSILFRIAAADKELNKKEEAFLKTVANAFHINEETYDHFKSIYFN